MTGEPASPLGTTLRVGTVRACAPNPKARTPAFVLEIDLGPHGMRTSSAQLTARHDADELVGRQVVVAMDLGTRLVAGVRSEVLVLGVEKGPEMGLDAGGEPTRTDESNGIVLLRPDVRVPDGALVH